MYNIFPHGGFPLMPSTKAGNGMRQVRQIWYKIKGVTQTKCSSTQFSSMALPPTVSSMNRISINLIR